jgi:hypothetical protein
METYTATAQDGSKHTRNSEKPVAYAIVGTWGKPGEAHGVYGWHTTLQLAQNKLAITKKPVLQQRYPNAVWEIVKVEVAA